MVARFDLDHLRLVVAVSDAGNFSRAASALARTQSAVSMQAKRCEEIAGATLFLREPRRIRLTAAGERLVAHARRILRIEEEARHELAGCQETSSVRLGVPDDYTHLLPPLLAHFAGSHPRTTLRLTCKPSAELFPAVEAGEIDLAIVTRGAGQRAEVLRLEPLVWVCARTFTLEEQVSLPVALYQPGCVGRDHALRALSSDGRTFRIAYESPSMTGLIAVVRSGLAVAVLARTSVPADLRTVPPSAALPDLPSLEIGLVRSEQAVTSASEALAGIIRSALSRSEIAIVAAE